VPINTLLLPAPSPNPDPVITSSSPTVIDDCDNPVTKVVYTSLYPKWHTLPRFVLFTPHDDGIPLDHTCTDCCGSGTRRNSPGIGSKNTSVEPFRNFCTLSATLGPVKRDVSATSTGTNPAGLLNVMLHVLPRYAFPLCLTNTDTPPSACKADCI
jgi:hypothetical protein